MTLDAAARAAAALLALVLAGGCAASGTGAGAGAPSDGPVAAVAAENQYADVVAQIGGSYVRVSSALDNPNSDPHSFEATVRIARAVSSAGLVVQNGLGYDTFMNAAEAAAPDPRRKVVEVARLLRLPAGTANPHLWYDPATMPAVARAVAVDLSALRPRHAGYFRARLAAFVASLRPWAAAVARLRAERRGTPVASTEPVADYLLQAAGLDNRSPWVFQADVMNGVDPAPQAVSLVRDLLIQRRVKAFVYNRQVTNPLTQSMLALARAHRVPVVAAYETMPEPGYHYQSWMLAETDALARAVTAGASTSRL